MPSSVSATKKAILLITNHTDETAARLIDRYAQRMIIENAFAEAIDLFHMDALSAAVPLKINVYLQFTILAARLYRLFANRIAHGHETHTARTLFKKFIHATAHISIDADTITVRYSRRANNPFLVLNRFAEQDCRIPWLGNPALRRVFRKKTNHGITA